MNVNYVVSHERANDPFLFQFVYPVKVDNIFYVYRKCSTLCKGDSLLLIICACYLLVIELNMGPETSFNNL